MNKNEMIDDIKNRLKDIVESRKKLNDIYGDFSSNNPRDFNEGVHIGMDNGYSSEHKTLVRLLQLYTDIPTSELSKLMNEFGEMN